MNKPYIIIEISNTHGGDIHYVMELLDAFIDFREGYGIKFQPLHPDRIATSDYAWYEVYKELQFTNQQWQEVIDRAHQTKEPWLDIFDTYGCEILSENIEYIAGIKLQSSALYNYEVINSLTEIDLSHTKTIINVAAQPIVNIKEILSMVSSNLQPQEILLEVGYQAYPTELEDSGLSKLKILKEHFTNRLVFSDHVNGTTDDAVWLPVIATMNGFDVIEKHVMLDTRDTKYDHFSSVTPPRFKEMVLQIHRYSNLKTASFINRKEEEYLQNTLMIPLLKHSKPCKSLINVNRDLIYRRSGKKGLHVKQIQTLQKNFHILSSDKQPGDPFSLADFQKATVATIIACRLKSSRLPRKALLPIGNLSSVERCIKSCLSFRNVNHTILATSELPEDSELESFTYNPEVVFHQGNPDDVVRRYLDIVHKLKVDVIIRVTADMPFVSKEIVEELLRAHFLCGSDYTVARKAAVGTSPEIINTSALEKVKTHFPNADYSEYMTWYFQNNPDHFNLTFVDLPEDLVREYRLTLDYQEDLDMFNKLQTHFDDNNLEFDIHTSFSYLDSHPEISNMNAHLTLRYKSDDELIATLNRFTKIPDNE